MRLLSETGRFSLPSTISAYVKTNELPVNCLLFLAKIGGDSRARNNFRIVSGHDDRPNSFLLGHVSFLAGQLYMMNSSFRGP